VEGIRNVGWSLVECNAVGVVVGDAVGEVVGDVVGEVVGDVVGDVGMTFEQEEGWLCACDTLRSVQACGCHVTS
jgi:large-conductance mechanosensitive channel